MLDDHDSLQETMPRKTVVATQLSSILAEISKLNKNAKTVRTVQELAEVLVGAYHTSSPLDLKHSNTDAFVD